MVRIVEICSATALVVVATGHENQTRQRDRDNVAIA